MRIINCKKPNTILHVFKLVVNGIFRGFKPLVELDDYIIKYAQCTLSVNNDTLNVSTMQGTL